MSVVNARETSTGRLARWGVGVFPGDIPQYRNRVDGLGLDSDGKRLIRLFVEPLMWECRAPREWPADAAARASLNARR
ncbi:hypothetical protein [Actinomycetospora flava]|uniref:Uncharacterized protein n=1 Tax=Actinomycetospora flava TaxID=3129232 RepID=A0ABU8MAN3_9PSEU